MAGEGGMTEPTYRQKIAAVIDDIGDQPYLAADEILAIRDVEMDQLRQRLAVTTTYTRRAAAGLEATE